MKLNKNKSSSRREVRKRHYQASKNVQRLFMSSPLSKDLRTKYNVRTMPIHKDDEVQVSSANSSNLLSRMMIHANPFFDWGVFVLKIRGQTRIVAKVFLDYDFSCSQSY